nr:CPBP family glutamic-type intramembrane protease [Sphingomicrobium sediminis]
MGVERYDLIGEDEPLWQQYLIVGLLFPLGEEWVFRYWLDRRPRGLILIVAILAGLAAAMIVSACSAAGAVVAGPLTFVPVFAAVLIIGLANADKLSPFIFGRFFPILFWLTAIGFAALHMTNFSAGGALTALFVGPQLIAGILFGYVRLRYGFAEAVAVHAANNSLAVSLIALGI